MLNINPSQCARLTLYYSLLLPLFDYADIVWGDKNNYINLMNHLKVMYNDAARFKIIDFPAQAPGTQALHGVVKVATL